MKIDLLSRSLYTFDEAIQKLGTDEEGFRQALRYHLQRPEQNCWIRACVDSRSRHFLATLDGDLSQHPHWNGTPALDIAGNELPDFGHDEFGHWERCGSNRGTGYGAVYALEGVFVVNPQNIRWIAEEVDEGGWCISNLLAVAPVKETHSGAFPNIHFVIVSSPGVDALPVPKDAKELCFFARDIDAVVDQKPLSAIDKSLDERERASLLCIIGALAENAKLDLSQPMKAGETVAAMLPPDVKLSARTIGEHLKAVRRAVDSRKV